MRAPALSSTARFRARITHQGDVTFRILELPGQHPPEASPVVLVHGIGMSHRYLSRLHRVLAESTRVFSLDLPGFGGLPKPAVDLDVVEMGAAIARVLEQLDVGPVVLVGHSMGTQWVVETAIQRPNLVQQTVIIGPVTDREHRSFPAQARALGLDTLRETPLINAIVFTDYVRCGIPWYLVQLRHMLAYPLEDRVAELTVPLLVIRGAQDPIAGLDWCRLLRDRAVSGALVQIPGHPHICQHSAPRAVAYAIHAHDVADNERTRDDADTRPSEGEDTS